MSYKYEYHIEKIKKNDYNDDCDYFVCVSSKVETKFFIYCYDHISNDYGLTVYVKAHYRWSEVMTIVKNKTKTIDNLLEHLIALEECKNTTKA